MSHPILSQVQRRPMATAQPGWAYQTPNARTRSQARGPAVLNPDLDQRGPTVESKVVLVALEALTRSLGRATVVLETSTYEEHGELAFFGSALIVLRFQHPEQMTRLLSTNPRARGLLDARVERELTERLGQALATLYIYPTVDSKGEQVHISCELAGTIHLQIAAR